MFLVGFGVSSWLGVSAGFGVSSQLGVLRM